MVRESPFLASIKLVFCPAALPEILNFYDSSIGSKTYSVLVYCSGGDESKVDTHE